MRISDWSSDVCSSDLRTDFSLARLKHYTGTPPEHVQRFVLFTNYHRYVDEFVAWACGELEKGGRYHALSGAGGVYVTPGTADSAKMIADSAWRKHQMPAYHLMAPDQIGRASCRERVCQYV